MDEDWLGVMFPHRRKDLKIIGILQFEMWNKFLFDKKNQNSKFRLYVLKSEKEVPFFL